jgi:3-oxoadipate enol-lactonase
VLHAMADPLPASADGRAIDRYFSADGARLRYRDEGSGPAVLLLHGWTLDLEMWNPLVAALRTAFRVVRLDRRGFGLSSGQPSNEHDIADLDALWRHLALEQAALIGMSQGARAIWGLASAAQREITCLVLDGPPDLQRSTLADDANAAGDDEVPLAHYRTQARTQGIDAFRRAWAMHPLMQLRTGDRNARQLLQAILKRYPGNDLLQAPTIAAACAADSADPEAIATPVLVITGEYDRAVRVQAADRLATRLPNAERAVVADSGHLPALDNPVAYNNLVREFLHRHAAARI